MAHVPSTSNAPSVSPLRETSGALRLIGTIDDTVYAVERAVVTGALLLMSGVVCLNILFQFLAAERAAWRLASAGDESWLTLWPIPMVAAFVFVLARAGYSASSWGRNNAPMANGLAALTVASLSILCMMMLLLPSHVVCALLAFKFGVWTIVAQLDRPRPLGSPAFGTPTRVAVAFASVGTVAATAGAWAFVPEGYTWAQKLALFLLLWIAFIGASMATHDGSHLRVDAVRKAMPARLLPYYNAASFLVAALFTAAFLYLSYLYLLDRLVEETAPGEIPDWLKVLSIPVSLAFVTIRFTGRSIGALLTGLWGLQTDDPGEAA